MSRIAIIGAGLSGLLTAHNLSRRGHQCRVFEKSRGLGGRLARRKLSWAEFDIGAPILTTPDDPANAKAHAEIAPLLAQWRGRGWLRPVQLNTTRCIGGKPQTVHQVTTYAAPETNNRLCHHLAEGLDIRRQQRINHIDGEPGQLQLHGEEHALFTGFELVVIAAPAAQCLALLPKDSPLSHQPFPLMSPNWTLTLQLSQPLPLMAGVEVMSVEDHPEIERIVALSALPGRSSQHLYQFSLTSAFCKTLLNTEKDVAMAQIVDQISTALHLPVVINQSLQCWNLASFIPPASPLDICDTDAGLVLAGDWTCGHNVEGAIASALRAEQAALSLLPHSAVSAPG